MKLLQIFKTFASYAGGGGGGSNRDGRMALSNFSLDIALYKNLLLLLNALK